MACAARPRNSSRLVAKKVAHNVIRSELTENAGHDGRDDLLVQGLRQICLDTVEPSRINAVADSDGKADRKTFARFHGERFELLVGRLGGGGGENAVANIESFNALGKRQDQMGSGVERAGDHAGHLADADRGMAVGHDHDARSHQDGDRG